MLTIHKYPIVLIAAIIIFQGINITIFPNKLPEYSGLAMIFIGGYILSKYAFKLQFRNESESSQIIYFITNFTGISNSFFFYLLGFIVLIVTILLNIFYQN